MVVAVLRRVFVVVGVVLRQCMSFFPLDKDMGEWVFPHALVPPGCYPSHQGELYMTTPELLAIRCGGDHVSCMVIRRCWVEGKNSRATAQQPPCRRGR